MTFSDFLTKIPGVLGEYAWFFLSAVLSAVVLGAAVIAVFHTVQWDSLWRFPVIAAEIIAAIFLVLFLCWSGVFS